MEKKTEHDTLSFQTTIKDLEEISSSVTAAISRAQTAIQDLEEISSSVTAAVSRAKSISEKFENQKKTEEDMNTKLSYLAQKAIQDSKGPLEPHKLIELVDVSDKQHKEILTIIRKYSDNADDVKGQLSDVLKKLPEYKKTQKSLDDKFIRKIKKLVDSIDNEQKTEMQTNQRQISLEKCYQPKKRKSPSVLGNSVETKNEQNQDAPKINKRLKPNSVENNTESKHPTESISVAETDRSSQHTELKN